MTRSFSEDLEPDAHDELVDAPDAHDELVDAVEGFEDWLESMREAGLITYDTDDEAPTYVGPGVDPSTEKLRGVLRLLYNESAEVPEDPIVGGELIIHVSLPSRLLAVLGSTPVYAEYV